jgi:hypothetical protein
MNFWREVIRTLLHGDRVIHPGNHWVIQYLKITGWEPDYSYLPENKGKRAAVEHPTS